MGLPGSITPLLTPMRLHRGGEQDQDGKSTDLPFANHYIKVYSVNTPHELPAELPGVAMDVLRDNTQRAAGLLKSLANPDRLLLLCQLVEVERSVTELESLTGIRQPTLSQQLAVLRAEAGHAHRAPDLDDDEDDGDDDGWEIIYTREE